MLNRHKEHLRGMGFRLAEGEAKGVLSGACYAGRENMFVIRSDGRVCKCSVALDDERNHVGMLDVEKGEMVIDDSLERRWSHNPIQQACRACNKLAVCCNSSCPLNKVRNGGSHCCCGK